MNTLIQKFLALFSTTVQQQPASTEGRIPLNEMPLASARYLREFAHRLGLEVDDLSAAEQAELKSRLDVSMDFREDNYGLLYHQVYQMGHGYSLADAKRVSAQISDICTDPAASAYLDYRENAVAAEALMAAGSLLQGEGDHAAAERLFNLADVRRHRSSLLAVSSETVPLEESSREVISPEQPSTPETEPAVADDVSTIETSETTVGDGPVSESVLEAGLAGLMDRPAKAPKPRK